MEITQPKVLGVDDWAYRKGVSYGTILIDMETSRPIEILPSRDGHVLKEWQKVLNELGYRKGYSSDGGCPFFVITSHIEHNG